MGCGASSSSSRGDASRASPEQPVASVSAAPSPPAPAPAKAPAAPPAAAAAAQDGDPQRKPSLRRIPSRRTEEEEQEEHDAAGDGPSAAVCSAPFAPEEEEEEEEEEEFEEEEEAVVEVVEEDFHPRRATPEPAFVGRSDCVCAPPLVRKINSTRSRLEGWALDGTVEERVSFASDLDDAELPTSFSEKSRAGRGVSKVGSSGRTISVVCYSEDKRYRLAFSFVGIEEAGDVVGLGSPLASSASVLPHVTVQFGPAHTPKSHTHPLTDSTCRALDGRVVSLDWVLPLTTLTVKGCIFASWEDGSECFANFVFCLQDSGLRVLSELS